MKEEDFYPKIKECLERDYGYVCNNPFAKWKKWQKGFLKAGIGGETEGLISDIIAIDRPKGFWHNKDIEIIAIEVKPIFEHYKTIHLQQAKSAAIFAHRCYFAAPRKFTDSEKELATKVGVGLLSYDSNKNKVDIVIPAPRNNPDRSFVEHLLYNFEFRKCVICGGWWNYKFFKETKLPSTCSYSAIHKLLGDKSDKKFTVYLCDRCINKIGLLLRKRFPEIRKFDSNSKKIIKLQKTVYTLQREISSLNDKCVKLRKNLR